MIIETIYVELTPSNATARVYVNGEPWNAIVVDVETDTDWTVVIEDEE